MEREQRTVIQKIPTSTKLNIRSKGELGADGRRLTLDNLEGGGGECLQRRIVLRRPRQLILVNLHIGNDGRAASEAILGGRRSAQADIGRARRARTTCTGWSGWPAVVREKIETQIGRAHV